MIPSFNAADDFLRRHGTTPARDFLFHREGLNVYLFPKAIQPRAELLGEDCFHAGRLPGEQLHFGDWERTDTGERPLVLVATSTTYLRGPEFFKMCMDALAGLSYHVVLSIGEYGDAKALGTLPTHVEIAQNSSHVQILRYASLAIGLGGIISTSEAAYHGVPTIALSCGYPENEWEQRCFEPLGTGTHLPKSEMNAENLRRAVVHVTEDAAIQRRVKALQQAVRREPGAEETVNRIEDYMETCLKRDGSPAPDY
jgi:dTDP-L-oleandrosyltransferase